MNFLKYVLLFLLFSLTAWTQTIPEPLFLNITFPNPSDTVNADRIRISGHTDPQAQVAINATPISLFPQGSFVTRVDLVDGMNRILVKAQKNDQIVRDILFIYRPPKLTSWPETPTRIDPTLIEPESDIWLMSGDYITVKAKGSRNAEASYSIEKFDKDLPMVELPAEESRGVHGVYEGVVRLTEDLPINKPLEITFELRGVDDRRKRISAPGKLYVLSEKLPIIGRVIEQTYVHGSARRYLPLFRVPENVRVHIIGRINGRFKIQLSSTQIAFVDANDVRLLPMGSPLPATTIGAPSIHQDAAWLSLRLPIEQPVPAVVRTDPESARIKLLVYGAQQSSHWITYPNIPVDIKSMTMNQVENSVFQLTLHLEQQRLWGYKLDYTENSLVFSIRRPPQIPPTNPLQHIIVALDPGHGGEETGAKSPLGVLEKDVNLKWAESLASILRARGARVVLVRQGDETVSLPERIRRATAANAHMYLSLHNNATTAWGNPLAAQGTSTYFTLPHNKELSWAIYPHMVDLGLEPYGRIHNSYYVTNSTAFLVTLIEGGFLTHPYEELQLADENFIDRMADAVYRGVVDFLRDVGRE